MKPRRSEQEAHVSTMSATIKCFALGTPVLPYHFVYFV